LILRYRAKLFQNNTTGKAVELKAEIKLFFKEILIVEAIFNFSVFNQE